MPRIDSHYELARELERNQLKAMRDAPAAKVQEDVRRQNELLIDSLPYGALGVIGEADASTPATWVWSDAEAPRNSDVPLAEFARNFLGYDTESQVSITNSEKRLLYEASEREVQKITPEAVRQEEKDNRAFEVAAQSLWGKYALQYSEYAADAQGAREAVQRLLQSSVLTKRQLAELAADPVSADKILDLIAEEQASPGTHGYRQNDSRFDGEDDRALGISTGANGGGRSRTEQDEQREGLFAGIADWQRKNGFTRF